MWNYLPVSVSSIEFGSYAVLRHNFRKSSGVCQFFSLERHKKSIKPYRCLSRICESFFTQDPPWRFDSTKTRFWGSVFIARWRRNVVNASKMQEWTPIPLVDDANVLSIFPVPMSTHIILFCKIRQLRKWSRQGSFTITGRRNHSRIGWHNFKNWEYIISECVWSKGYTWRGGS